MQHSHRVVLDADITGRIWLEDEDQPQQCGSVPPGSLRFTRADPLAQLCFRGTEIIFLFDLFAEQPGFAADDEETADRRVLGRRVGVLIKSGMCVVSGVIVSGEALAECGDFGVGIPLVVGLGCGEVCMDQSGAEGVHRARLFVHRWVCPSGEIDLLLRRLLLRGCELGPRFHASTLPRLIVAGEGQSRTVGRYRLARPSGE